MILKNELRMIAWEITRRCNLRCVHCRGASEDISYEGELSTSEARSLIDEISRYYSPVIIMTGGEPLIRDDIFDLIRYGTDKGLRVVLASNGTLIDERMASLIKASGVKRVSISIDGPTREEHDGFRGVPGAFDGAINGIENLKKQGVPFQINVTVTRRNKNKLEDIFKLSKDLGAVAIHIFLLVPMGRGKDLMGEEISPEEYEEVLIWFYKKRISERDIEFKATCAPHYYRIIRQMAKKDGIPFTPENFGMDFYTRGCLGGISFCFISYNGILQPCGYLEINCGNIRETGFKDAWENSPQFNALRNSENYKGKCGYCEFFKVCGGCRARAYAVYGDYLREEPFCTYIPKRGS